MDRIRNNKFRINRNNSGFTMVEMIVVLVVLAIITAIAVPVSLSIIESNKETDAKMRGKNIMTAVQTEFQTLAANKEEWVSVNQAKAGIILNKNRQNHGSKDFVSGDFKSGFMSLTNTDVADNIQKKIDDIDSLNMLYVAAGKVFAYYQTDERYKQYIPYVIIYQLAGNDQPVYFYNGKEVSKKWPFEEYKTPTGTQNGQNFKINGDEVQLYALKLPGTNTQCDKYWNNTVLPIVQKQQ